MNLREQFLAQVEAFLAGSGMKPTTFGRLLFGDPRFVSSLRDGREPTTRIQDAVNSYLKTGKLPERREYRRKKMGRRS